jgi:hypothetical protein
MPTGRGRTPACLRCGTGASGEQTESAVDTLRIDAASADPWSRAERDDLQTALLQARTLCRLGKVHRQRGRLPHGDAGAHVPVVVGPWTNSTGRPNRSQTAIDLSAQGNSPPSPSGGLAQSAWTVILASVSVCVCGLTLLGMTCFGGSEELAVPGWGALAGGLLGICLGLAQRGGDQPGDAG